MLIHATAVDVNGAGVLILGGSGAGKSDLALRLIQDGALLVCDDQVDVTSVSGGLLAAPAPNISGLVEARGVGILRAPTKASTRLRLAVELVTGDLERMPPATFWGLPGDAGPAIALVRLHVFEASAPAKLRLLLHSGVNP
jgi:serine kinase of HPr protein (carbohydrate metabolism regulator)